MPASTLEKLLNDKDQGVLLTALNRVSSNARNQEIIDRIEELANHPSRGIRLKVVDVARDCNRYDSRYRGILRIITGDSDPEVCSMAAVELARLGERLPKTILDRIKNFHLMNLEFHPHTFLKKMLDRTLFHYLHFLSLQEERLGQPYPFECYKQDC